MARNQERAEAVSMVRYRRNRVAGATYFFTVTLRNRRSNLLVREIDALRDAWHRANMRVPHTVIASVVLPDHLHAVIRMDDGCADFPRLWQDIKKGFVFRVAKGGLSPWQPRFWEHTIRDEADLRAQVDYVHINPMKHGLVTCPVQWPHSSFHRYVREGRLSRHWGCDEVEGGC